MATSRHSNPHRPARQSAPAQRVLVVDDDQDSALLLAERLSARGHETKVALDALDATLLAAKFNPNVAIIDLGLPGMNGHELIGWLRTHPEFERTVFIAITGNTDPTVAKQSLAAGFRAHLIKPIEVERLLELFPGSTVQTPARLKPHAER